MTDIINYKLVKNKAGEIRIEGKKITDDFPAGVHVLTGIVTESYALDNDDLYIKTSAGNYRLVKGLKFLPPTALVDLERVNH